MAIIVLVFFMFITEFTPSVVRAGIMGILILGAKIFFKKLDFATSISLSLLLTLISNPYNILNLGLQLSYLGTIGIVLLNKPLNEKIKITTQNKLIISIKETIVVCISAQLMILPILILNFNSISTYFLISNLLVSPLIGIIILLGFIAVFVSYISIKLAQVLAIPLNLCIQILIQIANVISKLPIATILIKTPIMASVITYYTILGLYIFKKRVKHEVLKALLNKHKKSIRKILSVLLIITILSTIIVDIPKEFTIYFIDVGQGDSTLIKTKTGKTILIDGGGSELESSFDVGQQTLLPYLLDRRIKTIDYMIVSHFDSDHWQGLAYIMKKLKIKSVIIGKQIENSENYKEFIELVKQKNIKINVVEAGERINIEKDLYIDILWPDLASIISDNVLNNNSLVCKVEYKEFSMLFTGDIEEKAERAILQKYKNNLNILNATVLKVAHHGSKTSSTSAFLEKVKPKIALIGVGEKNTFGHPSNITLENLKKMRCKIYRTDKNGEITIQVNKNGVSVKVKEI